MTPFTYARAASVDDAVEHAAAPGAAFLGGGTNLVDLMRETIERPRSLVDVTGLSDAIDETPDGGLIIGAAARNSSLAEHAYVRRHYPVLSRAIVAGASAQIRNMATTGSASFGPISSRITSPRRRRFSRTARAGRRGSPRT